MTRLLGALGAYGGGEKLESCKKEFPFFGSAVVAFFNQLPADVEAGRKAVKAKFGPGAIRKVTRMMKTGEMEIFQHDETPEALCYVMAVARSAEARAQKRGKRG